MHAVNCTGYCEYENAFQYNSKDTLVIKYTYIIHKLTYSVDLLVSTLVVFSPTHSVTTELACLFTI